MRFREAANTEMGFLANYSRPAAHVWGLKTRSFPQSIMNMNVIRNVHRLKHRHRDRHRQTLIAPV